MSMMLQFPFCCDGRLSHNAFTQLLVYVLISVCLVLRNHLGWGMVLSCSTGHDVFPLGMPRAWFGSGDDSSAEALHDLILIEPTLGCICGIVSLLVTCSMCSYL